MSLIDHLRARLEFGLGRVREFFPFGGPMNGATARLEIVRSLVETCDIQQIIETGTYRGTTTEWFSQFELPVFSAEINPRFAAFSAMRLSPRKNVQVVRGSSTALLENWLSQAGLAGKRTIFYLDAHWLDALPLREEIDIIAKYCRSWIIVIDDFNVPGDDGYRFDNYGSGKALNLDYVRQTKAYPLIAFFPNVASKWETGSRRGFVILVSDESLAERVAKQSLLTRFPDSSST